MLMKNINHFIHHTYCIAFLPWKVVSHIHCHVTYNATIAHSKTFYLNFLKYLTLLHSL